MKWFGAVLCCLLLTACSSSLVFPDDFSPRREEVPAGLDFTRLNDTFRAANYSSNPGFVLPMHYDQLYLKPDSSKIERAMYVYLSPNGTSVTKGELGMFVIAFKDERALESELKKVKDFVYFKDIRNFYIARKDRYILEFWSADPSDPRLRELFFTMQSRLDFKEVQPI